MPTDNILKSRTVVTAKVEDSYGTDPTPANTDAIEIANLAMSHPSEMNDREITKNTMGPLAPILGRKYGTLTFDVELKGSGTAGTAPDVGLLLRACGMAVTNSAGVNDVYDPISTGMESITIWVYRDGKIWEFNGCRGNAVLNANVGQPAMLSFTFWGKAVSPIDSAIVSPSVDATDPPVVKAASFSIGGYSAVIANLTLDLASQLIITDDVNDASGYGEVIIADRIPQGSFNPQEVLKATHDFYDDWEAGTSQALTVTIGSTAGNRCVVTAPAVVNRELNEGDRNGLMVWDIPFSCVESSGDDAFKFSFT